MSENKDGTVVPAPDKELDDLLESKIFESKIQVNNMSGQGDHTDPISVDPAADSFDSLRGRILLDLDSTEQARSAILQSIPVDDLWNNTLPSQGELIPESVLRAELKRTKIAPMQTRNKGSAPPATPQVKRSRTAPILKEPVFVPPPPFVPIGATFSYTITNEEMDNLLLPDARDVVENRVIFQRWYQDKWEHLHHIGNRVTDELFLLTLPFCASNTAWIQHFQVASMNLKVAKMRSGVIEKSKIPAALNEVMAYPMATIQMSDDISEKLALLQQIIQSIEPMIKSLSETLYGQSVNISTTINQLKAINTDAAQSLSNKLQQVIGAMQHSFAKSDASSGSLLIGSTQPALSQQHGALEDMAPIAPSKDSVGGVIPAAAEQAADWNPEDNVWSEEFLQQAAATFESNMAALLSSLKGCPEDSISQDQIAATFQMMAEAAAQVMKPSGGENDGEPELETDAAEEEEKPKGYNDVSAAISQALESMNANAGNLQNQSPFSEDDLKNMFSGMNLNGQDEGSGNMFLPFMQGMMQSLLSKEVLYPSLKDIVDRYPNWLETNKSTLSNDDFTRYTKQNELMNKVCSELETEAENDSEDVKKARFDKVLDLMQKMQELGQPPEELSGELAGQGALPPQMGVPDVNQCRPM